MKKQLYSVLLILILFCFIIYLACDQNVFYGVGDDQDVENPKISVSSPKNSDLVGPNFQISGKASDDIKLDKIKITAPGFSGITINAKSNWSTIINTAGMIDGEYRFTLEVSDESGKKAKEYLNVLLDKTGPEVSMYYPEFNDPPAATNLSGIIDFTLGATDNNGISDATADREFIIFEKGNESNVIFIGTLVKEVNVWKVENFNTNSYPIGVYTLRINFEDLLGNQSNWERDISLNHVSDQPTVYIDSPDPNADPTPTIGKYLTIHGYAVDNELITKVYYNIWDFTASDYVYGSWQEISTVFDFSETIDVSVLGLSNGEFEVHVYAEDNNSNLSDTETARFVIDDSMPTITILDASTDPVGDTPKIASYLNSDFNVKVHCSLSDATVEYKITQGTKDTDWNPYGVMTQSGNEFSASIDIDDLLDEFSHDFNEGAITIKFKGTKDANTSENSRILYLDKTDPQIDIISHDSYDEVNGAVIITGSAYDAMGLDTILEIYNPDPAVADWETASGTTLWSYVVSTDLDDIETKFSVPQDNTTDALFQIRVSDKAGNQTIENLHLVINPAGDIPKVIILSPDPAVPNLKVSGSLSILCTMDDDDYPLKDMTANISIYDDTDTLVPGLTKDFDKNTAGFPNLNMIVDTTVLVDGDVYTIKVNGTDWHGKTAAEATTVFEVDKNTPVIEITTPVTDSFKTDSINFTGKVKDENNCTFDIFYIDDTAINQNRTVTLTSDTPEGSKQVWTFDFTLNGGGADTGLGGPDINWADNEWGNNPHLFTLRATDETGSMSYSYIMINLDNHIPTGTISYPTDNHIIDIDSESTELQISGQMNDTPANGNAYTLDLNMIELRLFDGSVENTIKPFSEGLLPNFVGGSIPENFTYKWNHTSFADSSNYTIRMYVKDSANTTPVLADEITIIKNTYPPIIEDISYTSKAYYKGEIEFTVDGRDRGILGDGNGVDKIELLVDGNPEMTIEHNELTELIITDDVFDFDTDAYGSDGTHEISFRITDRSGLTHTKSAGNFTFDNGLPTISNMTYYTLGYAAAITEYSTYLKFSFDTTDIYSMAGDTPQYKMGTTTDGSEGGSEIFDWKYLTIESWNGQDEYTAGTDSYKNLYDYSGTIYITIKCTDTAGNERIQIFSIDKASPLPALDFDNSDGDFVSDMLDSISGDGNTEITGTVDSAADKLWIKVDSGAESEITGFGSGSFTKTYTNGELSTGEHTFTIRTSKSGVQNIVEKTFIVDNISPMVIVNDLITEKTNEGHVSGDDLSGKVIISGTYYDQYKDVMAKADANLEINIAGSGWVSIPTANITTFSGTTPWEWTYEWDSETLSSMVANNITIQVQATDKANNSDSGMEQKNVVPYISSINSNDTANYPVFDAKFYLDSEWDNHENRRYTASQDTPLIINGYNLKQGSTTPTLELGGNALTVTSSTSNEVRATIPANDTTGKSGNINITVDSITSTNVALYIWKFHRVGNNYDTLDARDFDITLVGDLAFVTFARDHQVTYYENATHDYSTYRMHEAATYNNTDNNAYNNYGQVDPMWFTANGIFDDYRYMASDLDEWTGMDDMIIKRTLNTDTTEYSGATGGAGNGTYTAISTSDGKPCDQLNTVKSGDMTLRETTTDDGYLYLSMYDDDSRETTPVPRIYLLSAAITNYNLPATVTAQLVTTANSPGPWNSVALTSSGYPAVAYYTSDNDKLNISYNTSSYTPTTFTNRTSLADGGKYVSMAISGSDLIQLSFQDDDLGLSYGVLNTLSDGSPSFITLESMANDGITGFNTSICLDDNGCPYISYINNSELNTSSALHIARFSGTVNKTNLSTQDNWEYMKIPSPVAVNSSNTVIKWNSSEDWPVIAFKGNNYIYIARLVQ